MNRQEAKSAALSPDWDQRAEAASILGATAADDVADLILRLLWDDEDLAVVDGAAEALLNRADEAGVRFFCIAYAEADDQLGDHLNDSLLRVRQDSRLLALFRRDAAMGQPGAIEALNWLHIEY